MKQFLKDLILEAGKISLDYKARLSSLTVNRKSLKDLVTEADVAVEEFLVKQIKSRFPEHAVWGEETGSHAGGRYRWVIDPIDGTTSFVHEFPFYSVSIALEEEGKPILAAVYGPVLNELFMAEKGKGATLNNKPIHVSSRSVLSDCMLATGFACVRVDAKENNLPYFNKLLPLIRDIRRAGSAALDLSYVACGRFDGYWEMCLKPFDIAAGVLIVAEAGGIVTDFAGGTAGLPRQIIAANPAVHPQLLNLLKAST
ncbi:MAG: inositol monophosphatase [Planctomycetaceae bacterium]|nr:inositol monophosphatase [Planctomycetaceae bacterium]